MHVGRCRGYQGRWLDSGDGVTTDRNLGFAVLQRMSRFIGHWRKPDGSVWATPCCVAFTLLQKGLNKLEIVDMASHSAV